MTAAPELLDTQPGDYFGRIAGAFGQGVDRANQEFQTLDADANARHPLGNQFAQGLGAVAPLGPVMAAEAPAAAVAQTGRGLPAFLAQTARGATVGGAYGAAYGAGTTDGDLQQRLQGADQGALAGAVTGAATPALVNTAGAVVDRLGRPAWEALAGLGRRLPVPEANTVGAMGGNLRVPPRPPTPRRPPIVPPAAINTIDRLATRARMAPEEVESTFTAANQRGMGETPADLFGDPGLRTTRAIVQAPGESGERAASIARQRFSEAPRRIINALRSGIGVSETRQEALARLAGEYERASAETYRPIFRESLSAENRRALDQSIARFQDDPVFRTAQENAQQIFNRDRRIGLVDGAIDSSFPRYVHYLKMGLDDAAQFSSNPSSGIGSTQLRGIRAMRAQFIDALDQHVPGYRDARARWGGIYNAEEALGEGAGFLGQSPEAVRARIAEMTPFEREHARIGLVDEIAQGMRGGRVVGQRNVANALDYADTQEVIASAFDNPQQAAEFLDVLNTQNRLMRNAQAWGNGSPTYSNVMHGADEMIHTGAEMTGHVATGNLGSAIHRGIRGGIDAMAGGAIERANNVRGTALLQQLDTPDAPAFIREVVRELRRRAAARAARATVSQQGAAGAGATSGRRRN